MSIIISQITTSTMPSEMVASLPQVASVPNIHRSTQNMIGDQMPPFPLSFTLSLSGREQPYGMPTTMMESPHPSASTYEDNTMATTSHINPYITPEYAISNLGQMAQPLGGLRGIDYSIRKKLDAQYFKDMAQLADRVRQVERLKVEKAKSRFGTTYAEGRLMFVENQKPQKEADYNPKEKETLFVEPVEVLMADVIEGLDTKTDKVNMLD
ncbi:hypothetical protein KIW84_057292 [Lathyrus oleraceus]|uniref:Uncharacterized protein n=1 Tax=Pisum sativum TaxID=3888 RepID=A0A9D4X5H9_PEA|nr:hypothetical protein KIW84_057292 [Pisum sativum]